MLTESESWSGPGSETWAFSISTTRMIDFGVVVLVLVQYLRLYTWL